MTEFTDTADTPSTVLDTEPAPPASGGGAPVEPKAEPEAKPEKPLSVRESLEKAAKTVTEKPEKAEAPDPETPKEPEGKEEPAGKPEAADAQAEKTDEPKPSEGKRPAVEPPARLLPKHRELWRHVPHELRVELERLGKEDEGERTRLTEQTQRYNEIAQYDEIARQNGGSLKQSLERIHGLEQLLQANPLAALNQIVLEHFPRKADGQPLSLIELARAVAQSDPQQVQQMLRQQPQRQQPQDDPRVQQLEHEVQQMRVQTVQQQIIEPFKAQHERYDELSPHIAKFLASDIIPKTLGPLDRLAHAYDMAEKLYPADAPNDKGSPAVEDNRGGTSDGSKSIKSSPGSVTEDFGSGNRKVSISDAIRNAAKQVSLRG